MPHSATDERSQSPESVFNIPESLFRIPGIRVHVRLESLFKIVRNTQEIPLQETVGPEEGTF